MASIALFTAITKFFVPDQNWFWLQKLILVHDILGRIFPWLICVSIAYHFAKPLVCGPHMLSYLQQQPSLKHSNYWNYRLQLSDHIRTIEINKLELLYQPLVCVGTHRCLGLEALLRIRTKSDLMLSPAFMDSFEHSGLAPTVDWWVAQDVKNQLLRHQGKTPYISININPQTLSFSSATTHLLTTFTGLPVRFEIVERGFFQSISTDHWRGRPCKNRPFFNRTTPYQAGLRFVEPSVCYVQQTRTKGHCRGLRNPGSV